MRIGVALACCIVAACTPGQPEQPWIAIDGRVPTAADQARLKHDEAECRYERGQTVTMTPDRQGIVGAPPAHPTIGLGTGLAPNSPAPEQVFRTCMGARGWARD